MTKEDHLDQLIQYFLHSNKDEEVDELILNIRKLTQDKPLGLCTAALLRMLVEYMLASPDTESGLEAMERIFLLSRQTLPEATAIALHQQNQKKN